MSEEFIFSLPIWVLEKNGEYVGIECSPHGRCLMFFTDSDLAARAIDEFPLDGISAMRIGSVTVFRLVLNDALAHGDTHVGLDVCKKLSRGTFPEIRSLVRVG